MNDTTEWMVYVHLNKFRLITNSAKKQTNANPTSTPTSTSARCERPT